MHHPGNPQAGCQHLQAARFCFQKLVIAVLFDEKTTLTIFKYPAAGGIAARHRCQGPITFQASLIQRLAQQ